MSTYTTRIIEVKVSTSSGTAYSYETLVSRYKDTAVEGNYYNVYHRNGKHSVYKFTNGEFVETDEQIPKVWKLVKFYSDYNQKAHVILDSEGEHYSFEPNGYINNEPVVVTNNWCNNGGDIRDNYISASRWDESQISGRGIPSDISPEAYELIKPEPNDLFGDYKWSRTWITLAEWESIYNKRVDEFKNKLSELYSKKSINSKLDLIINKLGIVNDTNNEDEYSIDEQIKDLWENEWYEIMSISDEIAKNQALAEHFVDGYYSFEDVRILYYLS